MGRKVFEAEISAITDSSIHLDNVEAIYDASNCSNPFVTRYFCNDQSQFTAYANGKSIANLANTAVKSHGPHMFSGSEYRLPAYIGVILHYESACLTKWVEKFKGYAHDSPDACERGSIPFKYYCDSLHAFAHNRNASNHAIWERWKLKQNRSSDGIIIIDIHS